MNEDTNYPSIDPKLEARIVALVLGEASDLEREELERLIAQRPELASYQAETQKLHGLLNNVATGDLADPDEDWKLPSEKRNAVLSAIGGEPPSMPAVQLADGLAVRGHSKSRRWLTSIAKIAAVFCVVGFFGSMMFPNVGRRQVASSLQSRGETTTEYDFRAKDIGKNERFGLSLGGELGGGSGGGGGGFAGRQSMRDRSNGLDSYSMEQELAPEVDREPIEKTRELHLLDELEEQRAVVPLREESPLQYPDEARWQSLGRRRLDSSGFVESLMDLGDKGMKSDKQVEFDFDGDGIVEPNFSRPFRSVSPPTTQPSTPKSPVPITVPALGLTDRESKMEQADSTWGMKQDLDGRDILMDDTGPLGFGGDRERAIPASMEEKKAVDEAFSTFSLHVSDVSFKLARAALASGTWPDAAKTRIEEFVNAFDYGDPLPSEDEKVACRIEQSAHPFLQQRNLLRVSMRTAAAGRLSDTPLRLTLLLDNSGSMERIDRRQTVRRAFALLAEQLTPIDQVTLISFARQPRLLADKVSGSESKQMVELIENLPSEGGTNIEAALQLASEKAREQQVNGAQNRIILLTDGAVNLGDANPERLSQMIEAMRGEGIAFDAAGISAEGLNDEILETLTRKGDGRYYLLDSFEAADEGFARQIAGALRPSAKNVKVQVEFNPKRVGRYKLLGFEKHRLTKEDFRNDQVDAAEMAAAEAGVAMYQFEALPEGEGDVGSVSVRFRDLSTGLMTENRWPIPYDADAPRPDQSSPSLRIAMSAAMLAARLRGDAVGATVDLKTLSNLIAGLPDRDRNVDRVGQLQQMIEQARQLSGE